VNRYVLKQEDFDQLLAWLDPDRERAGRKYEEIRARLVKLFSLRGVPDAEDLADETFNRVTRKVAKIAPSFEGDPTLYFFSVARIVLREYASRQKPTVPVSSLRNKLPDESSSDEQPQLERELQALDRCLGQLSEDNRKLLLAYYTEEKQAKIDARKAISEELGLHTNALRVRVHRLRAILGKCVQEKLAESED